MLLRVDARWIQEKCEQSLGVDRRCLNHPPPRLHMAWLEGCGPRIRVQEEGAGVGVEVSVLGIRFEFRAYLMGE